MPYYLRPKDGSEDRGPFDMRNDAYQVQASDTEIGATTIVYLASDSDLTAWQQREDSRFANGDYIAVPWQGADWYAPLHAVHYCHVSRDKPGMVAYTPDMEKGVQDRQTRTTPGRYLEQFAPHISYAQRDAYIGRVKADTASYKIATSADDIVRVYINGPSSCMAGDNFSDGPYHPVRVYGDSDLAVAYLEDGDRVIARTVIYPAKKRYVRLYGDEYTLRVLLEQDGYRHGSLAGAKVRRINYRNSYDTIVFPYVDGDPGADVYDDTWIILGSGGIECNETCGYVSVEPQTQTCAHCERDMPYNEDEQYCQSCEHERSYCENCNEDYWDGGIEVGDNYYCESCADSMAVTCCKCDETWHNENLDTETLADRARYHVTDYCPDCAKDLKVCADCDEEMHVDCDTCPDCGITFRVRCTRTLPLPFDTVDVVMQALAADSADDGTVAFGMIPIGTRLRVPSTGY